MTEKNQKTEAPTIEEQYKTVQENTTKEAIQKLVSEITSEAEQLVSQAQYN